LHKTLYISNGKEESFQSPEFDVPGANTTIENLRIEDIIGRLTTSQKTNNIEANSLNEPFWQAVNALPWLATSLQNSSGYRLIVQISDSSGVHKNFNIPLTPHSKDSLYSLASSDPDSIKKISLHSTTAMHGASESNNSEPLNHQPYELEIKTDIDEDQRLESIPTHVLNMEGSEIFDQTSTKKSSSSQQICNNSALPKFSLRLKDTSKKKRMSKRSAKDKNNTAIDLEANKLLSNCSNNKREDESVHSVQQSPMPSGLDILAAAAFALDNQSSIQLTHNIEDVSSSSLPITNKRTRVKKSPREIITQVKKRKKNKKPS